MTEKYTYVSRSTGDYLIQLNGEDLVTPMGNLVITDNEDNAKNLSLT